ncbi:MAG: hypothetical protein IT324_31655 [Anaerolineae bacterium]|nr:hypothetical protein [Anaerolineae bacterium]
MTTLVYVTLLLALLLMIGFAIVAARSGGVPFRTIAAYTRIPLAAGEAVESGKAVHLSFGSSAVRDSTTLSALATSAILYHFAERAALGDRQSIVTMSDPVTLGLGQDTLRRAYKAQGVLGKYQTTMARWYPQGALSLAFAAGVGTAIADEGIATNVLLSRYGPELMLIGESAIRSNQSIIAQSDQISGQAVAYAIADMPLIGEELYVGEAYLGRTALAQGGVIAQDILRYLIVVIIIGMAILAFLGIST